MHNCVLVWYWVNLVLVWYLSESCVSVMLSESFLWFLYEATPHLTTYKRSSTSWRWPIYQTGTESLSVVSTDPCWFIWYLSRSCLILLSVFWWSMQKWPWVWEKHYITKTTTSHLLSSSLLLCFSTFSFLLSCFSSSAALSLCLSPSSTSLPPSVSDGRHHWFPVWEDPAKAGGGPEGL